MTLPRAHPIATAIQSYIQIQNSNADSKGDFFFLSNLSFLVLQQDSSAMATMSASNTFLSTPTKTPSEKSKKSHHQFPNSDSNSRFEAYNRLQSAAVAFGEKLPIPEIVALGGQSDGKSSLLEALLGFRFNVREVEMGTRRPLILQMVHDSTALEPRCRFQVLIYLLILGFD